MLITALHQLELWLNLGVGEEERKNKQKLLVSYFFYQKQLPEVAHNDHNNDYICYATIAQEINAYCHNQQFRTIEFICYQLYLLLRKKLPTTITLKIVVEKIAPDVGLPCKSAVCEYGDHHHD